MSSTTSSFLLSVGLIDTLITERKGGRKTHQTTHSITDRKRMPAALVTSTTAKRGRRGNNREGRRGRPRKPNFLSLPPVSRRSSLRTPRRQHREDFYNVDEIVVDDEDDDYFEQEREEELDGEEEEEEEDFRSKKKLKLLLKLHHIPATTPTKTKAKRRSGSYPFSSSDEDAADDNGDSANVEVVGHQLPFLSSYCDFILFVLENATQKIHPIAVCFFPVFFFII